MSLHYIIDGYNIVRHPIFIHRYKHIQNPPSSLLAFIRIKKPLTCFKNKITIVFDGYPQSSKISEGNSNSSIIFSRRLSADDKIKSIVEEAANRRNIAVVSDDRELKFIVKSLGAQCMGIEEFIKAERKSQGPEDKNMLKPELSFSQIHKINQELRQIWLR